MNPMTLMALVGSGLLLILALVFWQRIQQLTQLLNEALKRQDSYQKRFADLDEKFKWNQAKSQELSHSKHELQSLYEEAKLKLQSHNRQVEHLKEQQKTESQKADTRIEGLRLEIQALTRQLMDLDAEKRELKLKADSRPSYQAPKSAPLEAAPSIDTKKFELQIEKLSQDLDLWKQKSFNAERVKAKLDSDNQKLKQLLRTYDPREAKKAEKRLASLEQLYASMKGLKELAEERSDNWEVALRVLSGHILGAEADTIRGIGALVSKALEKAGAELVQDDFSQKPSVAGAPVPELESEVNAG